MYYLQKEIAYFDQDKNNVGALTTRLSTEASDIQGVCFASLDM
jgi:ATP-binding cassette subfamily B (MDR/TAP) protein 1